jgi:hypothetical protein
MTLGTTLAETCTGIMTSRIAFPLSKVLELNKKDNGWFAFVGEAKRVSLKSFVVSLGAVYNTDSEETVRTYSLNLAVGINQLVRSGVIDTGLALQTPVGHTAADMAVAYVKALKSWRRRASSKVDDVAMKCIVDFFGWFEPKTLTRLAFAEDLATVLRKRSTSAVYQLMDIGLDALENSGETHGDCFVLFHYVLSVIAETNEDDVVDLDALAVEIEDEFQGAIESEDSSVGAVGGSSAGGGGGAGAGGSGAEGKEASASAGTEGGGGHGPDGSAECAASSASSASSASGGSGMCPKKVVWMAMVYSGLWAQKKKDCHVLFNDMAKKCFSRPELLTKAMVEEYAHHVPMLTTGSLDSLDLVMHAAQKLRGGAGGEDEIEAREEQEVVREVQHAAREVEVERLSSIEVVELVYSVLVRLKSPLLDDFRAKMIWAVMHEALDEDEDDEDMDAWLLLATLLFRQPFDVWKMFGVSMARGLLSLEEKLDGVREDAGEALKSLKKDQRVRRDAVFMEVYHLLVGSAGGAAGAPASNKRQRLNDDKDSGEESGGRM